MTCLRRPLSLLGRRRITPSRWHTTPQAKLRMRGGRAPARRPLSAPPHHRGGRAPARGPLIECAAASLGLEGQTLPPCMWAAAPCGGGGPITVHPSFKWHTTPQGKLSLPLHRQHKARRCTAGKASCACAAAACTHPLACLHGGCGWLRAATGGRARRAWPMHARLLACLLAHPPTHLLLHTRYTTTLLLLLLLLLLRARYPHPSKSLNLGPN